MFTFDKKAEPRMEVYLGGRQKGFGTVSGQKVVTVADDTSKICFGKVKLLAYDVSQFDKLCFGRTGGSRCVRCKGHVRPPPVVLGAAAIAGPAADGCR